MHGAIDRFGADPPACKTSIIELRSCGESNSVCGAPSRLTVASHFPSRRVHARWVKRLSQPEQRRRRPDRSPFVRSLGLDDLGFNCGCSRDSACWKTGQTGGMGGGLSDWCQQSTPRVVMAGVPRRMPEGDHRLCGSLGMPFLLQVMWAAQDGFSFLAGDVLGRRSTSITWLSVPPETMRRPRSTSVAPARGRSSRPAPGSA